MKCRTCEKEIPETSKVCPFCYATVVKENNNTNLDNTSNLTKIDTTSIGGSSTNSELNFGELSNTSYDSNNLSIGEGKKRKNNLGIIILVSVIVVVAILVIGLIILNKPKVYPYQYYTGVIDHLYDYLDENIISQNASNNGNYKLYYSYKGETKEFKGTYKFDVHKRLLDITGELKNPKEEEGTVVIDDIPTMSFELTGEYSNLKFKSNEIFDTAILLPYEDDIGYYATKQYDLDSLLGGYKEALKKSLEALDYEVEDKQSVDGYPEGKVEKISIRVDYKTKATFLTTFYQALLDDNNFVYEYSKIKGRKEEEIEKLFTNYKLTYEHKYSTDNGELSYIHLYHVGTDVVKIEIINERTSDKSEFYFKKNEVNYKKYKEDNKVSEINISKVDNTMNEKLTRIYKIDIMNEDFEIGLNLELKKEDNTSIRINNIENTKSIREFSQEELNLVKNNLKIVTPDVDWVDKLPKIFATKCTQDLTCVCDDKSCSCELNDKIITCPLGSVKQKEQTTE